MNIPPLPGAGKKARSGGPKMKLFRLMTTEKYPGCFWPQQPQERYLRLFRRYPVNGLPDHCVTQSGAITHVCQGPAYGNPPEFRPGVWRSHLPTWRKLKLPYFILPVLPLSTPEGYDFAFHFLFYVFLTGVFEERIFFPSSGFWLMHPTRDSTNRLYSMVIFR